VGVVKQMGKTSRSVANWLAARDKVQKRHKSFRFPHQQVVMLPSKHYALLENPTKLTQAFCSIEHQKVGQYACRANKTWKSVGDLVKISNLQELSELRTSTSLVGLSFPLPENYK
jgi:hypothetical protein